MLTLKNLAIQGSRHINHGPEGAITEGRNPFNHHTLSGPNSVDPKNTG
jgi:hypothetical protein